MKLHAVGTIQNLYFGNYFETYCTYFNSDDLCPTGRGYLTAPFPIQNSNIKQLKMIRTKIRL